MSQVLQVMTLTFFTRDNTVICQVRTSRNLVTAEDEEEEGEEAAEGAEAATEEKTEE